MKVRTAILILSLVLVGLLIFAAVQPKKQPDAAADPTTAQTTTPVQRGDKLVGVCLPSQATAWQDAGYLLKNQLEAKGYRVELAYGDGTAQSQAALLNTLIEKPVDCLVTVPADSTALTEAERNAKDRKIPLLAYGSLLMDSDAVSGYICYDYYEMGAAVARYIEDTLSLTTAAGEDRSYTLELFMGAPKDYNAVLLHNGILSVLQAYLDTGVLESKSNRLAFEDCCIPGWSQDTAAQGCLSRLQHSYADTAPDVCICASDSIAAGVISALDTAGIGEASWPLITGNGATEEGMQALDNGRLALTVRTDAADPAAACAAMADWVLLGIEPELPISQVFNNVVDVPTLLCGFELITGA